MLYLLVMSAQREFSTKIFYAWSADVTAIGQNIPPEITVFLAAWAIPRLSFEGEIEG